jgi:hypothetical protein
MANGNFVVQNGLTVGPLTIDALTGSISTPGTVSVTGGLAVSTISKNDSSITINDTGTGSTVYVTVDGTIEHTIDANGVNMATGTRYAINGTSVLNATTLGSGVTASSLTSVGTLGSLTVSGATSLQSTLAVTSTSIFSGATNHAAGIVASTVQAATIGNASAVLYGTLNSSSASQPNITTLAGLTSVGAGGLTTTVAGSLAVNGNLTVTGTSVSIGASTLSIQDPIININTASDLTPLSSQTTYDIGLKFHYYDGADLAGFAGRTVSDGAFTYWAKGTDTANVFTGTVLGTIRSGAVTVSNTTTSTSTSTGALQVAGGAGIAGAVYAGSVYDNGNRVVTSVTPSAGTGITLGSLVSSGPATSWSITNNGVVGLTVSGTGLSVSGSAGGTFNVASNATSSNTAGAIVARDGSGNFSAGTMTATATTAQYADLAENYLGDTAYSAGQVVEFGGSAEVTLGTADSARVAGIVSTNPAHLMNGGLTGNNVVPLALVGRVPCNVIGPIKKGDMLVSAGFGYAKASANPAMGQVIGKALADFGGAKGQIEVVVGRM